MGHGASTLPFQSESFNHELVNLFITEHERLKGMELSREDLKEIFTNALRAKESELANNSFRKLASISEDEEGEADEDSGSASAKPLLVRTLSLFANKGRNSFLVSVDGSAQSDCAFQCAMNLRSKKDNIILFHTHKANSEMDSLLPTYRAEEIMAKYRSMLSAAMTEDQYHMTFVERRENESVRGVLSRILKECRSSVPNPDTVTLFGKYMPDFVVIGYSGKKNEMQNSISMMGSSTDLALRSVPIPIIIAKTICRRQASVFVYSVDEKLKSQHGLDILLTLIRPRDTLIVVHVIPANAPEDKITESEMIRRYYEDELLRSGPVSSQFMCLTRAPGQSLVDCMVGHANDVLTPDFLVIAPRAKRQLASITEEIIQKSNCSVILCKM